MFQLEIANWSRADLIVASSSLTGLDLSFHFSFHKNTQERKYTQQNEYIAKDMLMSCFAPSEL
jgi:hypothetical protein